MILNSLIAKSMAHHVIGSLYVTREEGKFFFVPKGRSEVTNQQLDDLVQYCCLNGKIPRKPTYLDPEERNELRNIFPDHVLNFSSSLWLSKKER